MNYEDIRQARERAVEDIAKADMAVRQAAQLIGGRLRAAECYPEDLRALKRELQDFNAATGKWKERK